MLISTIGYEGSDIDDFVAVLQHAGIDVLVDVRDLPASRKRGFSKNQLKLCLEEKGIEYLHLKVLGDPKEGREAARSGLMTKFREIFCSHIDNEQASLALKHLATLGSQKHICLMCFERNHHCCHRSILIDYLKKICNFEVRNIGVPRGFSCKAA
ncbi:DUF488 family protein [Agrobacterium vitis]|uniref:DUF488 domain-containing protein n=1 Tax=Agrobacterium vitis TaxID=373 RepID=UPI0009C0EB43|nr:DUF488 domain-containing protein [Agrobacterium vitis]MCE6073732.1 DUF488 family protein [Agrobacterium vitis]MCM2449422.1 DUF488 domain-containing protein [Agrobacterium vitis]MCM2468561.1 DUF488 domain-containing protein [Agrobacterium vitis]MUO72073.1 DUF488 family protein [Agrobacterium vitis]MUO85620.1 DUF488 family protein [Agrobacterium vitis]